jgi:tRNA nucleotidyltransferase (CCA-adding enzyme)
MTPEVVKIAELLHKSGGTTYAAGGCVRDTLLKYKPKDYDLEVYGMEQADIIDVLSKEFELSQEGNQFNVIKIHGYPIDVSLPRWDEQIGPGHDDVKTTYDPNMSFHDACERRDLTINAMLMSLVDSKIIDLYGGKDDLADRCARPTSHRFKEDALRVLRAMKFIACYDLTWTQELAQMSSEVTPEYLSQERVWSEWCDMLIWGNDYGISKGLEFLREADWTKYYLELHNLQGCPQSKESHPEGDVWTHTLLCMEQWAISRTGRDYDDIVTGFGVLCHDFGKPQWTRYVEGKFKSHGHEKGGEEPARRFMERICATPKIIDDVVELVVNHLQPTALYSGGAKKSAVLRLSRKCNLERLLHVTQSDIHGRGPQEPDTRAWDWIRQTAEQEDVMNTGPKPIIRGKDLIDLGLKPGVEFQFILEACLQAQMDDVILTSEDGAQYIYSKKCGEAINKLREEYEKKQDVREANRLDKVAKSRAESPYEWTEFEIGERGIK